ncbi:MAG TPA: methyltransferase domain-containing protein [Chryseosolibacter sp.]
MPDFSVRAYDEEMMDDLDCKGEVIHQTLKELETINTLLGGNYVTINGISKLISHARVKHFSLADLGCGGGDILRLIRRWAQRQNIKAELFGIDANPNIVEEARQSTPTSYDITFQAQNIFSDEFRSRSFDIVTGTLFFHHFTNEQLTAFFRQLRSQTQIGFVINDIHRHWFAYHSIKWLTQFLSKSPMVQNDAPLSVLRAFRKQELIEILKNAGITSYSVRWMWAFRWQVIVYSA